MHPWAGLFALSFVLPLPCLAVPSSAAPVALRPAHERQQVRPLIVIMPDEQESVSGVASTQEADGETLAMRAIRAAGKVRDYLNDSHVVEAVLYSPDSPLFARAALEAKVKLARRTTLTSDEQVALSKAAGAIYVAIVGIQKAADGGDSYEMILQGTEIGTRKSYRDKAKYQILPRNRNADANAIQVQSTTSPTNAVNSAANTLVARLLNGPLAAYGRVTPPPVLPTPAAETLPEPAVSTEAGMVAATLQQSNALLTDGNTTGAIILLRRAINQVPLNLKLRMLLARTYLSAKRNSEAASEIKRAFVLISPTEAERKEAFSLLSEAFQQSGNTAAAQTTYEEVIKSEPSAVWARLGLADLLAAQKPEAAETQYRAVLQTQPGNPEAIKGLAHVLAKRGDFEAALESLLPAGDDATTKQARATIAAALFDEFATSLIAALQRNRRAWDAKEMTREAFYKATVSQVSQTASLVRLLKSSSPPDTDALAKKAYAHRLLGGSLLSQSVTALQTFLENGDQETAAQSRLWLTECQKELKDAADGQ